MQIDIFFVVAPNLQVVVIIKKGENVNVCIHDFDDVKEESNKAASNDKHLLQE